jgi:hypothetical protein
LGCVDKRERISFMSLIWLSAIFDMVLPQVSDSLGFYDPFVLRRERGF